MCIDHNFSEPFKSALGDNFACNFVSNMLKKGQYCTDIMKKKIIKEFVQTKKHNEDFENCNKRCISDNVYVESDVNVRDHRHVTENIEALHMENVISKLN